MKYRRYFGTSIVLVVAIFRSVTSKISFWFGEISFPRSEISFSASDISLFVSEKSFTLNEISLPHSDISLPLRDSSVHFIDGLSRNMVSDEPITWKFTLE